jgi:glycogen synthase
MHLRLLLEKHNRLEPTAPRKERIVLLASHEQPGANPSGYGQALAALNSGLAEIQQNHFLVAPYKHLRSEWGRPRYNTPLPVKLHDGTNIPLVVEVIGEGADSYLRVRHEINDEYFSFDSYNRGAGTNLFEANISGNYGGGNLTKAAEAFNLAIVEIARLLKAAIPDSTVLVHGHDHLTALAVILSQQAGFLTAFTVHNPAYTTLASIQSLAMLGLADLVALHSWGKDKADLLALALAHADVVSTVSETYAGVLANRGFAYGPTNVKYGEVLCERRGPQVIGIPNSLSRSIIAALSGEDFKPRIRTSLDQPVRILVPHRLAEQKGHHSFYDGQFGLNALKVLEAIGIKIELTFLADNIGDTTHPIAKALRDFRTAASRIRDDLVTTAEYGEELFIRELAESDLVAQPSLFEPHGLAAVAAQAATVIPVVTPIDGLYDTIGIKQWKATPFPVIGREIVGAPYGLFFQRSTPPHHKLTSEAFWVGLIEATRFVREKAAEIIPSRYVMRERALGYTPEKMAQQYVTQVYKPLFNRA